MECNTCSPDPAPLLSYHWAPYWKECPSVCSSGASSPDLVVRMETLGEDVREVTRRIGLEGEGEGVKMPSQFPHTHRQEGGHSSEEELASRWVVSKVFPIVFAAAASVVVLVAVAAICFELLLLLPLSQKSFDIFFSFSQNISFSPRQVLFPAEQVHRPPPVRQVPTGPRALRIRPAALRGHGQRRRRRKTYLKKPSPPQSSAPPPPFPCVSEEKTTEDVFLCHASDV